MIGYRALLADISPLRESSAFRRLWLGFALSGIGSQMTTFAVALQVYRLTHSSAAVGATGLFAALPAIVFGLFGGALIDAVDRRRLVLVASGLLAAVSAGFAAAAFTGFAHLWLLYGLVAVQSLLNSLSWPTVRTFIGQLLPVHQISPAIALTSLTQQVSLLTGPLIAGVLAATAGLKACYLIDALSFLPAVWAVFRLPAMRPADGAVRFGARAAWDGLRALRRVRVLLAALLADANATVLAMPVALFPALNAERFGGSPRTLGLFPAALAAGGLLGSSLSGPVGRIEHKGRGMLIAGAIWGASLALFGLVPALASTLVALAVAGAADVTSVVLRSTIIQLEAPPAYRGRINAIDYVVGGSLPQVGNFRAGVVASLSSPSISAFSGGLAATVGSGLIALAFPSLGRYRASRNTAADSPASRTPPATGSAAPVVSTTSPTLPDGTT